MKILIKRIIIIIAAVIVVVNIPINAMAAGKVSYDGNAKQFIFEPGSEESPTDLFPELKGIMPGDRITQKIQIKNNVKNNVKVKLYIKSTGAKENSKEFLSKLKMTVTKNGTSKLFASSAEKTAQLTDWVCLGTFYSGAEISLDVTLEVPLELDNTYQQAAGYINWQFKAEEFPVEESDPKPPTTGDSLKSTMYVLLLGGSMVALYSVVAQKKKKGLCSGK